MVTSVGILSDENKLQCDYLTSNCDSDSSGFEVESAEIPERSAPMVEFSDFLTDTFILAAGDAGMVFIDALESNLNLSISKTRSCWTVSNLSGEKETVINLGDWPKVSLETARICARALRVTRQGNTASDGGKVILCDLLELYHRRKLIQLRTGRGVRRSLDAALVGLLDHDVATVSRKELAASVDKLAERAPIQANRSLAHIKAFFGWIVGRGYLDANPASGIERPVRERPRDRTPSLGELVEIWRAAQDLAYPFGPLIQLLILTAARRDEIASMRITELDLAPGNEEGIWVLPAERSKNGRPIRVPLSPLARRIAEDALRQKVKAGPFVFTTTGTTPVSGWNRAKTRLDRLIDRNRRMGCTDPDLFPPWRIHDLRRSFATNACDLLHVEPAVADRCLNHLGSGTTSTVARVYGRSEMFDQRREALRGWTELVSKSLSDRCGGTPSESGGSPHETIDARV